MAKTIKLINLKKGYGDHKALPCPFCGNDEIVAEEYEAHVFKQTRWKVWCTNCLATIDPGWAQQLSTVLEMWNKRTNNN